MQLDSSAAVVSEGKVIFGKSLPILAIIMSTFCLLGSTLIVYEWKTMRLQSERWKVVTMSVLATLLSVFVFNILTYYRYNLDMNVQSRYLISIMPIFIMLVLYASTFVKIKTQYKYILLILIFALITQGGGVIKHIITSDSTWLNDNNITQENYRIVKQILKPLVLED